MHPSTIPSLNQVSLIGTVYDDPDVRVVDRRRIVTFGLSMDGGDGRVHRVVVHDEFLAQSVHGRLRRGVVLSVLGELDVDEHGSHVSVTSRRGSDLHLVAGGDVSTVAMQESPPQPANRPRETAPAAPAPSVSTPAPTPAAVTPPAQPRQEQPRQEQPRPEVASPAPPPAPASPRPSPGPAATPRPALAPVRPVPVAARPAASPGGPGAPRIGGIAGLRSVPSAQEQDDGGEPEESATRQAPGTGGQRPTPQPIPGRTPPRPASPPPRTSFGNGQGDRNAPPPLDPLDDDIPF